MFETIFDSMNCKYGAARRSTRLEVESLEGRDMPSTLASDWPPPPTALAAVWPPPPPAKISMVDLGGTVDPLGSGAGINPSAQLLGGGTGINPSAQLLGGGAGINPGAQLLGGGAGINPSAQLLGGAPGINPSAEHFDSDAMVQVLGGGV